MEMVQHLFQGIKKEEYEQMIRCFQATEKHYSSGELVCTYGENSSLIGVVLEGTLQLLRTHADGRQTILEQLEKGGFSENHFLLVPIPYRLCKYIALKKVQFCILIIAI